MVGCVGIVSTDVSISVEFGMGVVWSSVGVRSSEFDLSRVLSSFGWFL